MSEVTEILGQIADGDGQAAEKLLPLVYGELRKLAAAKMAREQPGQTLDATGLVHEAYIRLVDVERVQHWNSRGHFFSAAAEARAAARCDAAGRPGPRDDSDGGRRRSTTGTDRSGSSRRCQVALLCRPDPRRSCRGARRVASNGLSSLGLRSCLASAGASGLCPRLGDLRPIGVGSRFRATVFHPGGAVHENDSRPLRRPGEIVLSAVGGLNDRNTI